MTETRGRGEVLTEQRSRRAWLVPGLGAALVLAAGLVLVSPLVGSATANSGSDQRDLAFGMPLAWVHQDQRALDPPFPWQAGFMSPLEHPTSASAGLFIVDVAIVFAALMAAFTFVALSVRRARTARSD